MALILYVSAASLDTVATWSEGCEHLLNVGGYKISPGGTEITSTDLASLANLEPHNDDHCNTKSSNESK